MSDLRSNKSSPSQNTTERIRFTHITKDADRAIRRLPNNIRRHFVRVIRESPRKSECHPSRYQKNNDEHLYGCEPCGHWKLCFRYDKSDAESKVIIVYAGPHEKYNGFKDQYEGQIPRHIPIAESWILTDPVDDASHVSEEATAFANLSDALQKYHEAVSHRERMELLSEVLALKTKDLEQNLEQLRETLDEGRAEVKASLQARLQEQNEALRNLRQETGTRLEGELTNVDRRMTTIEALLADVGLQQQRLSQIVEQDVPAIKDQVNDAWELFSDQLTQMATRITKQEQATQQLLQLASGMQEQLKTLMGQRAKDTAGLQSQLTQLAQAQKQVIQASERRLSEQITQAMEQMRREPPRTTLSDSAPTVQEHSGENRWAIKELRQEIRSVRESLELLHEEQRAEAVSSVAEENGQPEPSRSWWKRWLSRK